MIAHCRLKTAPYWQLEIGNRNVPTLSVGRITTSAPPKRYLIVNQHLNLNDVRQSLQISKTRVPLERPQRDQPSRAARSRRSLCDDPIATAPGSDTEPP